MNKTLSTFVSLLTIALLSMVGCMRQESSQRGITNTPQNSAIVEKVQKAGAGNVAAASSYSLYQWMQRHPEVANEVHKMCLPARAKGDAQFSDTVEGKVCIAAGVD